MAKVWIPALLRNITGGAECVRAEGRTVREVIDFLDLAHPGIREGLCFDDQLKPSLIVAIDGRVAKLALGAKVLENSEIHFLQAVGGG